MRITVKDTPLTIEDKRCYLPFAMYDECPRCGQVVTKDIEQDYLSHPQLNAPFAVHFYHECSPGLDHEWSRLIRIAITVTEVAG